MPGRWLWLGALAVASAAVAGPVRFEAGPGCSEASTFEGLVTQADWSLSLQPEGNGWQLELSRGEQRALVRSLPAASSCVALKQAAQLILERYFREVAAGRATAPPPVAKGAQATLREAPSRVERTATPAPSAPREVAPRAERAATPVPVSEVAAREVRAAETAPPGETAPSAERSASPAPASESAVPEAARPAERPAASASPDEATGRDAVPPGVAAATEPPAAAAESPPPPLVASSAPPREPGAPLERRLELSAGAGALGAFGQSATDAGAFVTANAALRLGPLFRVGLLGGLATAVTRTASVNGVLRGTAWAVPFAVAAEAGACGPWAVELCAAAVAGVRGARGSAQGMRIFFPRDQWLIRPDVGVLARAQWRPWRGLFIALEAWAAFPLGTGSFEVDGIPSASIALPTVDVTGSLQLGWSWQIL